MQHVPKSGLVLRAMTTEDIPGGLRLCRASGWNQLEEDWRLFTDSPGSGGWLIERAGDILGGAAYMRYDGPAQGRPVGRPGRDSRRRTALPPIRPRGGLQPRPDQGDRR